MRPRSVSSSEALNADSWRPAARASSTLVCGGSAPAALGADVLAAAWDAIASSVATSPLAVRLEELALAWLRELFDLPRGPGVLTTGAHAANFVGLAAARQRCGEERGVDVAADGLAELGPIAVFATPRVHASIPKALAQLGLGRRALSVLPEDELVRALAAHGERPAIVVATAGDVDTGGFDGIARLAGRSTRPRSLAARRRGLRALRRTTPRAAAVAAGVERADSIATDAHKWLEVPYDCGVALFSDARLVSRVHRLAAPYLPRDRDPDADWRPPVFSNLDLGASRRARSLAVWSVLRARGKEGVRRVVEAGLDRAAQLARAIDASPAFERLAPVELNVVCFRAHPSGARRRDLDALNERVAAELRRRGRIALGLTRYEGRVALRAAFVNSRTRAADVDELATALGDALAAALADPARHDPPPNAEPTAMSRRSRPERLTRLLGGLAVVLVVAVAVAVRLPEPEPSEPRVAVLELEGLT